MNRRDEERETCAAQGGGGEGNHKEEGLSLSLSLSLSFFSSFSVFRNWPTFATRHARGSAGRIDPFTKQLSFPSFPPNRPQDTPLPFRPFYPPPIPPTPLPPRADRDSFAYRLRISFLFKGAGGRNRRAGRPASRESLPKDARHPRQNETSGWPASLASLASLQI